ncbi:hypothetical protein [Limnoglobus roseus]|uniref:Uncharacterized protein n=1 Tax=Limnoglobus roseus TaxID=2598579 RepID=A0A5C1ACF3_9BACT|nr:hypothetical protein [Limnoglobus roseus]QEL14784.1 hypothetical protein PX52LOC_01678 [Limnoglobus roseus]
MPDLSDVETVLVALITQIVYPYGTASDSVTGDKMKVFRGWPIPGNLDADLKAGVVNISVFPMDNEQNVTRFSTDWFELPAPRITLTATASGTAVTFDGTACCPLNAAVTVNGKPFVYPLQAKDTPTSVATALATLINTTFAASSSGPVVTVPGATKLETRLGTFGNIIQEVKRQKKSFRLTVWCNAPLVRDGVASALDSALGELTDISLTDGSTGHIRYQRTRSIDTAQKSMLYRRDFEYSVEFPTTITRRVATIVAEQLNVTN